MLLKFRLHYQPFVGKTMTQHCHVIQFSDDGSEWYDLEDDFPEHIGKVLIAALESLNLEHFEDLRPKWTDNNDNNQ